MFMESYLIEIPPIPTCVSRLTIKVVLTVLDFCPLTYFLPLLIWRGHILRTVQLTRLMVLHANPSSALPEATDNVILEGMGFGTVVRVLAS